MLFAIGYLVEVYILTLYENYVLYIKPDFGFPWPCVPVSLSVLIPESGGVKYCVC